MFVSYHECECIVYLVPTPIRTIESFLNSGKPPNMIDNQDLQHWIDRVEQLEQAAKVMAERSKQRDGRIIDAVLERNSALVTADRWKRACRILAQQASSLPQHQHTSIETMMHDAYAQAMRDD